MIITNGVFKIINFLKLEKETLTDSFLMTTASLGGNVLVFISTVFLARILGPSLFGTYKTITHFFFFLPALFELGINNTLIKYGAEFIALGKERCFSYLIKRLLILKLLIIFLLGGIIIIFRETLAQYFFKDIKYSSLFFLGVLFLISGFLENSRALVAAFKNFKLLAKTQFILSISWSSLVVIGARFLGITGALIGIILSYPLANFLNIKFLIKKRLLQQKESLPLIPIFKKYSLPMYLISLPQFLNFTLIPVLALFYNQTLIGYFGFAFAFYSLATLTPFMTAQVLFPYFAEFKAKNNLKEAREKLKKIFILYFIFFIIALALIFLLARPLIDIVAPNFLPAVFMIKILFMIGLLFGFFSLYGFYLAALARLKKLAVLTLSLNIILFILSFGLLYLAEKGIINL